MGNEPLAFKATDRYTERIWYDKNSNIEGLKRYGMNNQRQYGLIDSLFITRNGNQLKTIEDYAEKHLTYTGASDFYDGMTSNNEYSYNANGALVKDLNRKIGYIGYDNLGNIRNISFHTANANSIEYIYAADGTKLRTIHRPASSSALTDSIDYIGNLILKNGQPSMYIFDGGYASFGTNGAVNGWHYYISDYMGNNRMVVNSDGTIEQVTHYYPYGGVIGDISTNENLQKYKFEGKELDRTFGLDNYDIHARQYFAMAPTWDRIDNKAEDYYHLSPYSYCGGDPVNKVDMNGDDFYVLLAKNGGRGFGHMALLIQGKGEKWYYYSKEGHGRKSVKGDLSFDSFDDFQASDDRLKYGKDRYTNSYLVKTDETDIDAYGNTPDERATAAAELEIDTEYNPVTANCANVVKSALLAVGRPDGTSGENLFEDSAPNMLFPQIVVQNEIYNLFKRLWDSIKNFFSK